MKKIFMFMATFLFASMFALTSCSSDDDNEEQSSFLNEHESALVGSYISDDDDSEILYLSFKNDRTGTFELKWRSETKNKYNFIWSATRTTITETRQSDGKTFTNEYVLNGKHLIYGDASYQKQ